MKRRVKVKGYYNQYGTYVRSHSKLIDAKKKKKNYEKKRKTYRFPEWVLKE